METEDLRPERYRKNDEYDVEELNCNWSPREIQVWAGETVEMLLLSINKQVTPKKWHEVLDPAIVDNVCGFMIESGYWEGEIPEEEN